MCILSFIYFLFLCKFAFFSNLWYNYIVFKNIKKEGEIFMHESYKFFPMEERQWNLAFIDASKNKDKKKIFELLGQAGNVYLDEYHIDHTITELNNSEFSKEKRAQALVNLKNNKIVKDVVDDKNTISIKTDKAQIMISKLSDIIPGIEDVTPSKTKDNVVNKSQYRSEYISQMLTFQNSVVTGYTYGIADKAKSIDTWVEFKNNRNQEFVVFPDTNTVYNKEGFYFLKHAEPIKKVASDDLKGKSSIGKSSSSNSELGMPTVDIDIEIDMGDER